MAIRLRTEATASTAVASGGASGATAAAAAAAGGDALYRKDSFWEVAVLEVVAPLIAVCWGPYLGHWNLELCDGEMHALHARLRCLGRCRWC